MGCSLGCWSRKTVWLLPGKEQDLTDSTRAVRMDGEELPMNELIWKLEMKLLRQQHCGTERVSRRSVAGSSQGLCHASARPNQGLQVVIRKPVCSFSLLLGFAVTFLRLDSKLHQTLVYLNRNARHSLIHGSLSNT